MLIALRGFPDHDAQHARSMPLPCASSHCGRAFVPSLPGAARECRRRKQKSPLLEWLRQSYETRTLQSGDVPPDQSDWF